MIVASEEIIISNKIVFEKERYIKKELNSVCCNVVSMMINELSILYMNQTIVQPFDITIDTSNAYVSSDEYNSHNPKGT